MGLFPFTSLFFVSLLIKVCFIIGNWISSAGHIITLGPKR